MRKVAVIAALWAFLPGAALAASFTAVAVTGFNYGGIVPNNAAPPYNSTAMSLDGASNDALFQAGLPSATAGGLPQSGTLPYSVGSNSFSFVLGPYGGFNLLQIPVNQTGTLMLASPGSFTSVAILGFSTQNRAPGSLEMVGDVTLYFSDGSSSVYSMRSICRIGSQRLLRIPMSSPARLEG